MANENSPNEITMEMEFAEKMTALVRKHVEDNGKLLEELENLKLESEQKFRTGQSLPDPFTLMRFMEFHFGGIYLNTVANNCWDDYKLGLENFSISSDGLIATSIAVESSEDESAIKTKCKKGIRAKIPFFVDIPTQQPYNLLFYFEVLFKKLPKKSDVCYLRIVLAERNFPVRYHYLGEKNFSWFDEQIEEFTSKEVPYSIGENAEAEVDDVFGCGLLLMPNGKQRQIFFTKNGKPTDIPVYLPEAFIPKYLYPAVTVECEDEVASSLLELEANFGNNPLKPFRYRFPITHHEV